MRKAVSIFLICLMILTLISAPAWAADRLPQIDCSTARIPITQAIYDLFTTQYQMIGPEPICSKTNGAWLNLADGNADIIFLVSPTQEEFDHLAQQGVDIEMKIYGFDGLVFLGNELNPVTNLTAAQIRSIYSGSIKNWSRIPGGKDSDMVVYIRNPESGSQRLFENLVWSGYAKPDFASLNFHEGEINPVVSQRTKTIEIDYGMESVTRNVLVNQYSIAFNIMSYIDSEFLQSSDAPQSIRMTGDVNMRGGPGLDYWTVGSLSRGRTLPYMGDSAIDDRGVTWYQAEHPTQGEVWISSRYSTLDGSDITALKLFSVDGYAPTTENFASGNYPFVTTSYVVIRADEPADSPVRKLYDWIGSTESYDLISQNSTLSVAFSDSVVVRTTEGDADIHALIARLNTDQLRRDDLYPFTLQQIAQIRRSAHDMGASLNLDLIRDYERALWQANANRLGTPRTLTHVQGDPAPTGDDVLAIQKALSDLDYLSPEHCDGHYGPRTANAVRAYQAENALSETGEADFNTTMMLVY